MSYEQQVLMKTAAGRRLIAYLTLFNRGDIPRLASYIRDNYSETAFKTRSADEWEQWTADIQEQVGKLRIHQVVAVDDYYIVVIVQAQKDDKFYINEYKVDEEHPHKVLKFNHQPAD